MGVELIEIRNKGGPGQSLNLDAQSGGFWRTETRVRMGLLPRRRRPFACLPERSSKRSNRPTNEAQTVAHPRTQPVLLRASCLQSEQTRKTHTTATGRGQRRCWWAASRTRMIWLELGQTNWSSTWPVDLLSSPAGVRFLAQSALLVKDIWACCMWVFACLNNGLVRAFTNPTLIFDRGSQSYTRCGVIDSIKGVIFLILTPDILYRPRIFQGLHG